MILLVEVKGVKPHEKLQLAPTESNLNCRTRNLRGGGEQILATASYIRGDLLPGISPKADLYGLIVTYKENYIANLERMSDSDPAIHPAIPFDQIFIGSVNCLDLLSERCSQGLGLADFFRDTASASKDPATDFMFLEQRLAPLPHARIPQQVQEAYDDLLETALTPETS
jgi:hypothetical protein